jgi:hypothetical protein
MRKFLFIYASIATLAIVDSAQAQYLPSDGVNPGYKWREERAQDDWRNNTWREQRLNEDWRNNNWRTQRANEDWRQREDYTKQATPNNAIERGYVGGAPATGRTNNNPIDTTGNPVDSGSIGGR